MALAQMVGTEDDGVFTNYQQPSEFCANFHQVRPAARDTRKLSLTPEAAFGCQAAVVVPAHGDLLLGATLEVKLQKMPNEFPVSRAAYYPVEALARRVSITVGGCVLDTHTSDFFRIYDEHVRTPGESQNYRRLANFDPVTLTSAVPCTERLYLPLVFSFFRSRKSALPLAALRDTEVRLTFDFATAEEVGVNAGTLEAALYVDYGLVDEGVRARLTRQPIDILFEQVQWNGGQLVPPAGDSHSVRIVTKLGFRRQVKAVWWLLKETEAHDPARTQHGRYFGDWQNTYLSLQPSQLDFGGYNLLQSISEKLAPVAWARILFDGQERFPARRSHLFNMLQPLQCCGRGPLPGTYCHAFTDAVGSVQPQPGLCNFSRFREVQLQLQLKKNTGAEVTDAVAFAGDNAEDYARNIQGLRSLHVFAWSYNVLAIRGGQARPCLT